MALGAAARTPRIDVAAAGDDAVEDDGGEEEEEEDVDFNPFMREEASSEASSGLSSENEAPGDAAEVSFDNSANREVVAAPEQLTVDALRNLNSLEPKDHELTKSLPEGTNPQKRVLELDEEDLICRRTRARHSLEDYTLEELETFLQESDNEDNVHNADDESEYRRFLSAVLNGDSEVGEGDGNFDDDENDADFAIEIEGALESDGDEYLEDELGVDGRRPVTRRQRKGVKGSKVNKKHNSVQFKTPVRPILPYVRKEHMSCSPPAAWQLTSSQCVSNCSVSESGGNVVSAFTDDQISQLYCLMHEHAQLLIQVYSVSVLDPSKQKIAVEVRKMIGQILDKREQALAQSRDPYRGTCFLRQNLHPSVHSNSLEITSSAFWAPLTDKPVRSIFDVAPLALAKSFMTDVSAIVLKQKQSYLEDSGDKRHLEKIPLFPLPTLASSDKSAKPSCRGSTTKSQAAVQPHSSGQQQQKKSLATTIVENNKTGLVALVPKDIAVLAQRFYPIFNPTLFPPTPPPPSVAGRVLFTDAEDGLLAMGIMEYNNEWTKIQQRFLPCKSQHQIFVRQKNRSSSKAPENPIKNVRRMKISPLTADELAHICEGLKLFKEDWNLVWKYCVPHRDPSLLPRQWRVATGTQKSYKATEAFKVKRRVYEANRRRQKASAMDSVLPEKEVGDEENMAVDMDDEGEAYVHEAFLANAERRSSKTMSSDIPFSSMNTNCMQLKNALPNMFTDLSEKCAAVTSELRESPQPSGAMHGVVMSSEPHLRDTNPPEPHSRDTNPSEPHLRDSNPSEPHLRDANPSNNTSFVRYSSFRAASEQLSPNSNSQALALHLGSWSSHMPERRGSRVVKLAPGLPPVNLPRSVRVISQPGSRICIKRSYVSKADDSAMKNYQHGLPQVSRKRITSTKSTNNGNMFQANDPQSNNRNDERLVADQCTVEENASESDFHMHPLLFQDAEGQASSYYSTSGTASGTYNFFPELSLQANSNLHGHQIPAHIGRTEGQKEAPLNLITLDFHPLLQRADNGSGNYAFRSSIGCPSGDSEALQGNCDKFDKPSDHGFRVNPAGHAELPICTGSPSHREKEKIDLEISLCSVPEKEKSAGVLDSRPSVEENIHPLQHVVVQEGLHGDNRYINHKYKCPQDSFATISSIMSKGPQSKNFLSIEVVPQSNAAEVSHDVSVPEIVMEQEELSDSEEEIQDVEFEREEMDDSEGEGFNSEQPSDIQTKELLNSAFKGSRIRQIQDLNQMPQEPTEGKTGGMHQESRRAKMSRLKPNNEGAKRGRSCRSSVNASGSRTRKPRKPSGVK